MCEYNIHEKEKKFVKEQRKLSKKQIGSENRFKQRLKVRKIQKKIRDIRRDFLHKTSNSIAKNYDGICLEDLNIKGMMKNHCLAKSIGDVSWWEFNRKLNTNADGILSITLKLKGLNLQTKHAQTVGVFKECL